MKHLDKCAALLILCAILSMGAAPAQVGGDVAYKSKYIWRGIPINTQSVLWPDAWINWNELTLLVFGSVNLTKISPDYRGKFTEVDLYLDYTHSFEYLSLSLGYAHYSYPGQYDGAWTAENTPDAAYGHYGVGKGTGEFYATMASVFPVVNLSVSAYVDIINVRGVYLNPSLVLSHTVFELLTPTLSAGIGVGDSDHNGAWFGVAQSGITDFTTTFQLAFVLPGKAGEYLSVGADVGFATIIDSDLQDTYSDDKTNVWFGFTVSGYFDLASPPPPEGTP